MKIVDSHVHFWDPTRMRYRWLDDAPTLNKAFLSDHVPTQAGAATVEGIVFVQADCAPEQGETEANWVSQLAEEDGRIRGIVAFAPVAQGEAVSAVLEELSHYPLVKGVRQLIQDQPPGFATTPDFIAGVKQLAARNWRFDICIRCPQMDEAIALVRACPEVQFVLDHAGKPNIRGNVFEPWGAQLRELATLPNVVCKLSGIVTEADQEHWTAEQVRPYIDHVLNVFGADRVMYGSDAPVLYATEPYEKWVRMVEDVLAGFSEADREKIWRENAVGFYQL